MLENKTSKNNTKPFLSVVIPSYNEAANIERGVLDEVLDYLLEQDYTWEIILSDDGSTDSTPVKLDAFAKKHTKCPAGAKYPLNKNIHVLHNQHAGKGPTVTKGMLAAQGQWRLFTDFDQSTPIKDVKKLLSYRKNNQVILGSREMIGAKRDKEPLHRHVMGRGFNILVQILAVPGILDTQCGFKLFSEEATVRLFNGLKIYSPDKKTKGAFTGAFDVELLFMANKFGFNVKEVPISWKHHESDRVSPIKDSLRMLRDIVKIRITNIKGGYKIDGGYKTDSDHKKK